jgi:hypothetical protein
MRALILSFVIGSLNCAGGAVACEWTDLGQRRAAADRIVEGRVVSVRMARVWVHDWKIQVDRVATVEPLTTIKGQPQSRQFDYLFSAHEAHDEKWTCSGRPDRALERGQTGYFLWEGQSRPTLALTPTEFRQRDLDY